MYEDASNTKLESTQVKEASTLNTRGLTGHFNLLCLEPEGLNSLANCH